MIKVCGTVKGVFRPDAKRGDYFVAVRNSNIYIFIEAYFRLPNVSMRGSTGIIVIWRLIPAKTEISSPLALRQEHKGRQCLKPLIYIFALTYCKVYRLCKPNFKLVCVSQTRSNTLTCTAAQSRRDWLTSAGARDGGRIYLEQVKTTTFQN